MQDKVPSNVVCLMFGSSCLMNSKKHILLDNVCSLPYSLRHWQHILYNSLRQCTRAIYTCKSVICYICSIYKQLQLMSLTAHFIQQFKAM